MPKPASQAVAKTADTANVAELRAKVVDVVVRAAERLREATFTRGRERRTQRKLAHGPESQLIIALYARAAAYLALQPRPEQGIAVAMTHAQIADHAEDLVGDVLANKVSPEAVSDFAYHWRLAIGEGFTRDVQLPAGTRWRAHLSFRSGNDVAILSFDIEAAKPRVAPRAGLTPVSTYLPTQPPVSLADVCRVTANDADGQHALRVALSALQKAADRGNAAARRLRQLAQGAGLLLVAVVILGVLFPKPAQSAFQHLRRFVERWFTRERSSPPDPRFRGQLQHRLYHGRAPNAVRRQGSATIFMWQLTPTQWHFAVDASLPTQNGYGVVWEWTFSVAGHVTSIERSGAPEITHIFSQPTPVRDWSLAVRPLPFVEVDARIQVEGGYLYVLDAANRRISPGTHEYVCDIIAPDGAVYRQRLAIRDAGKNRSTVTRDVWRPDGTLVNTMTDEELFARERGEHYGRLRFPTPGAPALLATHWYLDRQWVTFAVQSASPLPDEETLHLYFGDGTLPSTAFEDPRKTSRASTALLHSDGHFLLLEHHYDSAGPFTATVLAINKRTGHERVLDQILIRPGEDPPMQEWWFAAVPRERYARGGWNGHAWQPSMYRPASCGCPTSIAIACEAAPEACKPSSWCPERRKDLTRQRRSISGMRRLRFVCGEVKCCRRRKDPSQSSSAITDIRLIRADGA